MKMLFNLFSKFYTNIYLKHEKSEQPNGVLCSLTSAHSKTSSSVLQYKKNALYILVTCMDHQQEQMLELASVF